MKFKLVTRKNMGPDQEEVPEKIYAQMVCGDYVPFDEFVEEVADSSGVGSAGVKAVIDRTVVVLPYATRTKSTGGRPGTFPL